MSFERQVPQTPLTVVDTNSIDLTASGAFNATLQADARISATAGNIITVNADGLYVPKDVLTTLGYNAVTGVLTYVDENGAVTTINLPVENFLSAATYNNATDILTLTLVNGTTFNVNLADLLDSVTTSGVQGLGTAASPIKENFDNLPAAPATLPVGIKFVMASDGANNDGSIATVTQIVSLILSQICSATTVAYSPTGTLYLVQNIGGVCSLVTIASQTDCAAAGFGNLFLANDGAWRKPNHRWNWAALITAASTTVNLANNNAFRVDATLGNRAITVPAPTACDNTEVVIKRHDATANTVTVSFTPTVDGVASVSLVGNSQWGGLRGEAIVASWTGSEWTII